MSIHIQLERFEGPLGLLLHLIRKEEMDIFDINIHQITKQYMSYIKAMKQLDLELAGEFVAMAATLIQIKSRLLLPSYNDEGEEIEDQDPRRELVARLLEYQQFQDASKELYERSLVGRDVFLRGERLEIDPEKDGDIIMEEGNALFALVASYRKAYRAMKKSVHRVSEALQSISGRIFELKDYLLVGRRRRFSELITADNEKRLGQVLVTFLSLLELAKMGFVSVFQSENFSEIHIEAKKSIDGDVMARVESYDGASAATTSSQAQALMEDSTPTESTQLSLSEADAQEWDNEDLLGSEEAASDEEILAEEQRMDVDQEIDPSFEADVGRNTGQDMGQGPVEV